MTMPTIEQIIEALQNSWSADTSFDASEWSPENPARGQCVVSSLVVQHYLGGDLRRFRVSAPGLKETHYCNVLENGMVLDTTASQYKVPVTLEIVPVDLKGFASIRDKRLAEGETRTRYEILKLRVADYLARN